MITIKDFEQGSEEWKNARLGKPTSSHYNELVTSKGEQSKQREAYMYRLAGERITGISEEKYKNDNMERGIAVEPEARSLYELMNNLQVETVGLCYKDDKKLTAGSPDGLVCEDGGLEIKCPKMHTHVGYLLKPNTLVTKYFQQAQGGLFITGRKWWDLMSYYPGMKPLIIRVTPDASFHSALEFELQLFTKELDIITDKIK